MRHYLRAYCGQTRSFKCDIWRIEEEGLTPDFVVVPDKVGAGWESLNFSEGWFQFNHLSPSLGVYQVEVSENEDSSAIYFKVPEDPKAMVGDAS